MTKQSNAPYAPPPPQPPPQSSVRPAHAQASAPASAPAPAPAPAPVPARTQQAYEGANLRKTNVSPTPTQLQNQIGKMKRGETAPNIVRHNSLTGSLSGRENLNISRQNSADSVASSLANNSGRETPASFRDIQHRYGTPSSPREFVLVAGKTPISDIDYQKTARQTVMGELSK